MPTDALLAAARDVQPDTVALRRRIHRHPELGLSLPLTVRAVEEALEGLGLPVRHGAKVSSLVADLEGAAPGPMLLLRADLDALPMPEDTALDFRSEVDGVMHACGHDAHAAMLVAAARVLAARRGALAGRIRFAFQPGEEGFHGAKHMIDDGLLDGVDGAFALHVSPNVASGTVTSRGGPLMASADVFAVTVEGRGGHASMPYLGNDPIPVACEVVLALQTLVTRRVDAFDPAVLTVTRVRAGTTDNVIPETAELVGTVRTVSAAVRERVLAGVERVAAGIAAAHEMRATVTVLPGYGVTRNDPAFASFVGEVARDLLGPEGFAEMPAPVMGAEDFSYVLDRVPGALAFLGVCPPGLRPGDAPGCHSNRMLLDEDAMATGAALHAAVALAYLQRGGVTT